ncbi:PstS family phosphate ABC transporter substrate-binding protein [Rudaea sp.]|uniref:PstS family phosphate ABC transporter substrate-binding protein n=1 Tax=Rudaea sp. TaxID=2136325 RepID=UPI002ED2F0D7
MTPRAFRPLYCGIAFALSLAAAAEAVCSDVDPALPRYAPAKVEIARTEPWLTNDGAIRIVGYNDMRDMFDAFVARYVAAHPGSTFRLELTGTRAAPPALAANTSALAPMGAEFTPDQLAEYRQASQATDPVEFRVAHASLDPRALSGPLAVFVHADNPLRSLTLAQLAQVFSGKATHWRDLGVQGDWANRPIHLYTMEPDTPLALSFYGRVLGTTSPAKPFAQFHQSRDTIDRIGTDPLGIGFAAAMRVTDKVRLLALAAKPGATPVLPTEADIRAGRYPLDRWLLIYARLPLSAFAREFLILVLSREGQQAIADTPQHYLPLSAEEAAHERAKLR